MAKKKAEKNNWKESKGRVTLQPYTRWLNNWWSYHTYCLRRSKWFLFRYTVNVVFVLGLLFLLRDIGGIGALLAAVFGGASGEVSVGGWISLTALFASVVSAACEIGQRIRERKNQMAEKFVTQKADPSYYQGVAPPEADDGAEWVKKAVYTLGDAGVSRTTMYMSEAVDAWLMDGEQQKTVRIEDDPANRAELRRKLSGSNFTGLYYHFLRFNYRQSQFYGKQFTNEKKWGQVTELKPGLREVLVQKTCYYDSYLTNTAPGKKLLSTRDGSTIADLEGMDRAFVPYSFSETEGKQLVPTGAFSPMANEPGVTTLMILSNGELPFWVQSNQAQSNPGQVVAAGSGSADWEDCEPFLGEEDGLRKAVITGMERELYEESIGKRAITEKEFKKASKTMVTGYFRWLEKGGKAEYVGFSCADVRHPGMNVDPEESEVYRYEKDHMQVKTVQELQALLAELAHPAAPEEIARYGIHTDVPDEDVVISRCNLSTTAAILALQRLIAHECRDEDLQKNAYSWLLTLAEQHDTVVH